MVSKSSDDSSGRSQIDFLFDREAVGLWMISKIRDLTDLPGGYMAIGVVRDGKIIGGCLYTDYHPCEDGGNIQIWTAGEGNWLSRRVIRVMFAYPFEDLGCHKINAIIAKPNKKSRRLCEGLGFKLEGVSRKGINAKTDACIYGLLKTEFKYG